MADGRDGPPEWAIKEASSYLAELFVLERDYSRLSSVEYEQRCLALLARIYVAARAQGWRDAIEACPSTLYDSRRAGCYLAPIIRLKHSLPVSLASPTGRSRMASQMIERVPQAIAAVWGHRSAVSYLSLPPTKKALFCDAARAAIKELSDADAAMVERGAAIIQRWRAGQATGSDETMAHDIWQAMCDEALSE